ncbi:MAG: hypothetical protein FWG11_06705 [Promicromonosporaceae bacterium]|nr:hypothetical protein [Promicromonosporaceae bacterium]
MLPRDVRARLRGLSKDNAQEVGEHLVMAGRLMDLDPELAYQHAQAAVRKAGRIDVVREAAGLTAYVTERYGEALRELRTVRRLNGSSEHLALMADSERGLGRPERALALAQTDEVETLTPAQKMEFDIVIAGARADLHQFDAALAVLDKIPAQSGDRALRVLVARSLILEAAGRKDEADAILATIDADSLDRVSGTYLPEDDVYIYDGEENEDELDEAASADEDHAPDGDPADEASETEDHTEEAEA